MNSTQPVDLCLASLRFYPDYAGPAQRFQRYAPGLRERGVHMRVFSGAFANDKRTPEAQDPPANQIQVPDIPVDRVVLRRPYRRDQLYLTYFRALSRYCVNGQQPDVVQFLNSWPWAPPWLWKMKRVGIPLVFTETMLRDPDVGSLKNMAWSLPMRLMDRIVVSTGVMRDELRSAGISTAIEIIPNGVDLGRFRPCVSRDERMVLRLRLGLKKDDEVITFVGGFLNHRKGLDVLVEAWARLAPTRPRARLVLVGPHLNTMRPQGPQADFLQALRAGLDRAGGEERALFTGEVAAVEDYFRATDVFVFPSRREGMPNVVAEAFACGVASVLTRFVGLPAEFGQPGREYVLADREPEAIASAVAGLLADGARRAEFGSRARTWVERELDVERSLDRYAELYRGLVRR